MVANVVVSAVNFAVVQAGNWDLRAMWGSMSGLARAVVLLLFVLSAWSLGVMIDRALMYSAARKQSRVFVQQVAGALREGSQNVKSQAQQFESGKDHQQILRGGNEQSA